MRITDIKVQETREGSSELSARVQVERPFEDDYRIWFRGPRGCFGNAPLGDVFFAGFWIPAMFLHEALEIEGEISSDLLEAAYDKLEPILLRWHARHLVPARVQGASIVAPVAPAGGRGCMYSGGLDSSYTISKHFDSVSHLIFVRGFDIAWNEHERTDRVQAWVRDSAREMGKELIVLHSNLGDPIVDLTMRSPLLDRPCPAFHADIYFGSMLVSFGLCLRGLVGEALIPASWTYEYMNPRGSHPLMEPNWSTSSMAFQLDGCEADRVDKAALVLEKRPELLNWLRVCTRSHAGPGMNCGKCVKCMKTMVELRLAGAPEEAYATFNQRLDPEYGRRMYWGKDTGLLTETYNRAVAAGDLEMSQMLELALRRRFSWGQFMAGLRNRQKVHSQAKERSRALSRKRGKKAERKRRIES